MKDDSMGIMVLLGIMAIALFGGAKNINKAGPISNNYDVPEQNELSVEEKTKEIQNKLEDLKKQIQIEEDKKTQSEYKGIVTLSYINKSTNPSQEYLTIKVDEENKKNIPITGWTIKSVESGNQFTIPKGTYLFFTGMMNSEENIILSGGDVVYLVSGVSPNGANFKVNKCSGYLGQFQTYIPYLNTSCPLPRNEDLASIPKLVINDDCLDYIEFMSQCKIQTEPLPTNWSTECRNFIIDKINYPSCIKTHKDDKDFYKKEWRVYLKRTEHVWKDRRETVVLYDNLGKVVDTLKY